MNFTDALMTAELVLESNAVPLLVGESGIGKTALVKRLGEKDDFYVITIDGNLLKEGEIGGLPTVEDYQVFKGKEKKIKKKTVYAVHTKLLEIDEVISRKPEQNILLFIDEINRCEHSVQQELMNIILNREINGFTVPGNVKIIAAMNPSNKYDSFAAADYQVVDMDPAQENRFVWIEMDAEVKTWIQWAKTEGNIHNDIIEFIASFSEFLHTPNSSDHIKATPRSWERISKAYEIYLKNKDSIPSKIFYNVVKGNVGSSIAQDFYNYLENSRFPLMSPKDIFGKDKLEDDIKKRIKEESHSRLYLAAKNALIFLSGNKHRKEDIKLFSEFLQLFPADLKMGIMQEIKHIYEDTLYKEFMQDDIFVNGYFAVYELLNGREEV